MTITPPNASPATTILRASRPLERQHRLEADREHQHEAQGLHIKLSDPGEQGTPGKLTFRVQLTTIG